MDSFGCVFVYFEELDALLTEIVEAELARAARVGYGEGDAIAHFELAVSVAFVVAKCDNVCTSLVA